MRTLIPIIACLVLVGCGWFDQNTKAPYTVKGKLDSLLTLCQLCQPETVTLLVKIDSTTYYDGGTEHHWSYVSPDTVYRMPEGRWVDADEFYTFYLNQSINSQRSKNQIFPWPDSLFFLSKPGEE